MKGSDLMSIKLLAHFSVLFRFSAFVFIFFYLAFNQFLAFPIILFTSILFSELILQLFLEIRVVHY